jgi:hypothetical protein
VWLGRQTILGGEEDNVLGARSFRFFPETVTSQNRCSGKVKANSNNLDDMDVLHVKINHVVGVSYLDIEEYL